MIYNCSIVEGFKILDKKRPIKTRDYTNHPIMDGSRWHAYNPRQGDIVVSTSYKAGTTWTLTIIANLLYPDGKFPAPVSVMAPWLDMRLVPLDEIAAGLEAQTHRRFIKSHLALDGIPFFDEVQYVIVGRDARDVFMSLWNHHTNYSEEFKRGAEEFCKTIDTHFPADSKDLSDFLKEWLNRGWFDEETNGYPYWSYFNHIQSWWDFRHLNNIFFIHFSNLLADPEKEIRRLAAYLEVEIDEQQLPGILERISFGGMKKNFSGIMPEADLLWREGGSTFMNKGTNGRWKEELSETDLNLLEETIASELSPECAAWLAEGGEVE